MRKSLAAIILSCLTSTVQADEPAFWGQWKIQSANRAPWEDPAHPMVTDDAERYVGRIVEISRGRMSGPDLLGCGEAEMKVEALPFAGLFEGGLAADPTNAAAPYDEAKAKRLAKSLGFQSEPVESLLHGCSEIVLHKVNARMLAFGLNNRIFLLEKQ